MLASHYQSQLHNLRFTRVLRSLTRNRQVIVNFSRHQTGCEALQASHSMSDERGGVERRTRPAAASDDLQAKVRELCLTWIAFGPVHPLFPVASKGRGGLGDYQRWNTVNIRGFPRSKRVAAPTRSRLVVALFIPEFRGVSRCQSLALTYAVDGDSPLYPSLVSCSYSMTLYQSLKLAEHRHLPELPRF